MPRLLLQAKDVLPYDTHLKSEALNTSGGKGVRPADVCEDTSGWEKAPRLGSRPLG